jgi:hypothetical protein
MPKPNEAGEIWTEEEPRWFTARVHEQMQTVDFADLRNELRELAIFLEPINLPTEDE